MTATLHLRIRRDEGALVRVLGLMGRRGFEVVRMVARMSADERGLDVAIHVRGDRSGEILARQIARLADVETVNLLESEDA